jgi:hypothetical protein
LFSSAVSVSGTSEGGGFFFARRFHAAPALSVCTLRQMA